MPQNVGSDSAFLSAFKATGSITQAAAAAQVERTWHYRRLRKDPAYKRAFDKICDEIVARKSEAFKTADSAKLLREEIRELREQFREFRKAIRRKVRDLEAKVQGRSVRTTRRSTTPPSETEALLDQIAHGMAKKPFSKLSPPHQDAVRSIAGRITGEQPD